MSRQNLSIVLNERPEGDIIPGQTFRQETGPAPTADSLQDGQVLVENLYLSLDPAMRGWLRDKRSYLPPVPIGGVMRGNTISRVLASKSSKVKEGDVVFTLGGWTEVAILPEAAINTSEHLPKVSNYLDYLGACGMTGLTAYFGMEKIANVKPGETVVVSGAAGATGSIVGQIAKLKGARVVGIAGAADKCAWLKELGFDEALNYKDADFAEKFREATKGFIDVYWDNVGGEILDMALGRAKEHARFVICGAISEYNSTEPRGIKNYMNVIAMRIRMEGFIVLDYREEFTQARQQLAEWLDSGKIQRKETIVKGGLKAADQALVDLYKGMNTGKLVVEIKNPGDNSKL